MKCCNLTSGKLRHLVTFEREQGTDDGGGGEAITWSAIAPTVRAWVKPVSCTERMHAQRLEADVSHRVYVRYRTDLLTSDRINFNGRLFQIRAILNIEEANRWLEIYADEGPTT